MLSLLQVKKILCQVDTIGSSIQHIKVQQKRWYDDTIYKNDNSKPLKNVSDWTILTTYQMMEEEIDLFGEEIRQGEEEDA